MNTLLIILGSLGALFGYGPYRVVKLRRRVRAFLDDPEATQL